MPISKTPTDSIFPVWSTGQCSEANERYEHMVTPAEMKTRSLFGIPLRSALTNEIVPDETLQFYIDDAISELEHELDIYITPVTFREKHDYKKHEFTWNYNYLKLNHPNVISVEAVELSFSNNDNSTFVSFPLEHVHVQPQEGVIQLVPAFGTSLSGFLISAFSGTQFHALRSIGMNDFPGGLRIEYTSGFEKNKIPAAVVGLIENMAAYKMLSIMSPIIFPYNSVGISLDGVSQSTGTSGPQFLKTRMDALEKSIESQKTALKGYYQRSFQIDVI